MSDLPERLLAIAETVCDWHAPVNARAELEQAAAELARLRAIVEKLPVTKDGVSVVPGMVIYGSELIVGDEGATVMFAAQDNAFFEMMIEGDTIELSECYSTREAAAARKGAEDGE